MGYLEEQAVVTYTHILDELDAGRLPMWEKLPAPELAVTYWKLPRDKSCTRSLIFCYLMSMITDDVL